MIYITRQEGLYQIKVKVNSSLISSITVKLPIGWEAIKYANQMIINISSITQGKVSACVHVEMNQI